MLNRREFLAKGAAAGVGAMAGGGLLQVPVALGATPGFGIGEQALKVSAHDQYEGKVSLRHLRGKWVVLDVCARWCPPCNAVADQLAALVAEANGHGIPLTVLSVLREGEVEGGPAATRADAEFWAVRYGYERESVLHCGGSKESPLFKLISVVCGYNEAPAAFPCHLLIDPTGVVRYFTQGAHTEALKDELANLSGVPMPGGYSTFGATPRRAPNIQSVSFSFGVQGGGTVSETLALGASSSACEWFVEEEEFKGTPARSTARTFLLLKTGTVDLSVPISVVVHPQRIRTYAQGAPLAPGIFPLVLYTGPPANEETFLGGGGRNQILNLADGTGSGLTPVDPQNLEYRVPAGSEATMIELEVNFEESSEPYGRTREILETLASAELHRPAQKLLHGALKELSHHNFASAATDLSEAAKILGYSDDVARHVAFLANT